MRNREGFPWNTENTARLRHLIEVEGCTFSEAAKSIGCGRQAAIGRANRQNITSKIKSGNPLGGGNHTSLRQWQTGAEAKAKRAQDAKARRQAIILANTPPKIIVNPPARDPQGKPYTTLTIRDGLCRWPIGDPTHEDYCVCGNSTVSGFPYCLAHNIRAINQDAVKFDLRRQMRSLRR